MGLMADEQGSWDEGGQEHLGATSREGNRSGFLRKEGSGGRSKCDWEFGIKVGMVLIKSVHSTVTPKPKET